MHLRTRSTNLPIFAGRMAMVGGTMRIRCGGQGVPFTSVSSDRTLHEAIRSVTEDSGDWLVDPVNGADGTMGIRPAVQGTCHASRGRCDRDRFSWHHAIGDMQTLMFFMNAWAAAAAGKPLAEPLIVEDRAAYLDEHLPADGAREPGVRCLGLAETARSALYLAKDGRKQRTLSLYFGDDEIARMRDSLRQTGCACLANDVVCAHVSEALMNADPAVDRRTLAIAVNARNRCGLDPMLVGNIITTLNVDIRRGEAAQLDCRTHPPWRGPLRRRTLRHAHQPTVPGRCRRMAGRSLRVHWLQSGPVESAHHERERLRRVSHHTSRTPSAPTARS